MHKEEEESLMFLTKRTILFFLGIYILLFTLPNFIITLFIFIYYLMLEFAFHDTFLVMVNYILHYQEGGVSQASTKILIKE